jgi:hypothetical protein
MPEYKPLDPAFNRAVIAIARNLHPHGFDVSEHAPETLEDLKAYVDKTGRMVVYKDEAMDTIFADHEARWAFRAWHDSCHLRGMYPFTVEGERRCRPGADRRLGSALQDALGANPEQVAHWAMLIHDEVLGQVAYAVNHGGHFPTHQRAEVEAFMIDPGAASAPQVAF